MITNCKLQITDYISKKQHTVFRKELLRNIPKKRSVFRGTWQNKPVIIKIFKSSLRSKRNLLREWRGLNELKRRNITTAKSYLYGQDNNGNKVIVIEEILNAETALKKIEDSESVETKLNIFRLLIDELARLNNTGVFQRDLHLDNFLINGKTVYPLDTTMMKFHNSPLGNNLSLKQIALLCWYIPAEAMDSYDDLIGQYAKNRSWDFDENDKISIRKYIEKHHKKAIKKGLEKCLRTSKRQIKIKTKNNLSIIKRCFHDKIDTQDLLDNIDEIMATGKILKNGRTCFVSTFDYQGFKIVAKKYNNKGFWHSLRQTIKLSRARKNWLNGHLLQMLRINTPKPLAFIIVYKNFLIRNSYILTEFIEGENLHYYLENNNTSRKDKQKICDSMYSIIDTLHKNRITHGDIKKPNILITNNKIYITDLDAMTKHRILPLYFHYKKKDIQKAGIIRKQL